MLEPGTVSNEIHSHQDMLPTLVAAAGDPDVVEKLKKGVPAGKKNFKVHIDGVNLLPFWKGEVKENPRQGFLYWSDEGDVMALRVRQWKMHFQEQRSEGLEVWQEPTVLLRLPKLFNLRSDPFENADVAAQMFYGKWRVNRAFLLSAGGAIVAEWVKTMMEFPPRQHPDTYSVANVLEKLDKARAALAAGQHQ